MFLERRHTFVKSDYDKFAPNQSRAVAIVSLKICVSLGDHCFRRENEVAKSSLVWYHG